MENYYKINYLWTDDAKRYWRDFKSLEELKEFFDRCKAQDKYRDMFILDIKKVEVSDPR